MARRASCFDNEKKGGWRDGMAPFDRLVRRSGHAAGARAVGGYRSRGSPDEEERLHEMPLGGREEGGAFLQGDRREVQGQGGRREDAGHAPHDQSEDKSRRQGGAARRAQDEERGRDPKRRA